MNTFAEDVEHYLAEMIENPVLWLRIRLYISDTAKYGTEQTVKQDKMGNDAPHYTITIPSSKKLTLCHKIALRYEIAGIIFNEMFFHGYGDLVAIIKDMLINKKHTRFRHYWNKSTVIRMVRRIFWAKPAQMDFEAVYAPAEGWWFTFGDFDLFCGYYAVSERYRGAISLWINGQYHVSRKRRFQQEIAGMHKMDLGIIKRPEGSPGFSFFINPDKKTLFNGYYVGHVWGEIIQHVFRMEQADDLIDKLKQLPDVDWGKPHRHNVSNETWKKVNPDIDRLKKVIAELDFNDWERNRIREVIVHPDPESGDYTTIAVACQTEPSGTTIEVCPGTYQENKHENG